MNLKNSLYTIQGVAREGTSVSYELLLNAEHTIYQAHFPNEPITPGVCILQILKELLEEHTGKQYEITKVISHLYTADRAKRRLMRKLRLAYDLKYSAINEDVLFYCASQVAIIGALIGGLIKEAKEKKQGGA